MYDGGAETTTKHVCEKERPDSFKDERPAFYRNQYFKRQAAMIPKEELTKIINYEEVGEGNKKLKTFVSRLEYPVSMKLKIDKNEDRPIPKIDWASK